MPAKKTKSATTIVRTIPASVPRGPAPIIKVSAPRAAPKKAKRRRSSSGGGTIGGAKSIIGAGIGGLGLGLIEKYFPNLPTVPVLGRAGTIAIGAYFLSRRGGIGGVGGPIMRDIAVAGAVLAGYQLGKQGKIEGDDSGCGYQSYPSYDVSGIAAQI